MRGVKRHFGAIGLCVCALVAGCDNASFTFLRVMGPAMANLPRQVQIHNSGVYAQRDGKPLYFDLYQPFPRTGPTPLIINIHGSGWYDGSRDQLVEYSYDLAANGYATAQIDYRLTRDGATFPEPVADVLEAVRYFKANADQYGIDPDRIALFGASAGGHLALLAGMNNDTSLFDSSRPRGEQPGVKVIVDLFGPTDLTVDPMPDQFSLMAVLESFFGGPLMQAGALRSVASPVDYVRADGPAILIMHGDIDMVVPVSEARAFNAALESAGQIHQYVEVPGMDHTVGAIWSLGFAQNFRPTLLAFLADHL